MKRFVIIAFAIFLSGCVKYSSEFIKIDQSYNYSAKPDSCLIGVYTEDIRQEYEILAVIHSYGNVFTSSDDLLEALKGKARQVGADAIIVNYQVIIAKTGAQIKETGSSNPSSACLAIRYKK